MTLTNEDVPGDRQTSWSAALDQAAAGRMAAETEDPTAPRRLILISGGNIDDHADVAAMRDGSQYPMEDPVPAWNPIGVGGFTDRDQFLDPIYRGSRPATTGIATGFPARRTHTWDCKLPEGDVMRVAGSRQRCRLA